MRGHILLLLIMSGILSTSAATVPNTWQQEVNHSISVILNDIKHELVAFSSIQYRNNSPSELHEIYIHLWPNAYKNRESAFAKQEIRHGEAKFWFSKAEQRGYIDSLDFKVNGKIVKWEYDPVHIDICRLILNEPLKSGQEITITTPFRVKIPDSFSRLGHTGQSYQITQWYPKPAVYDATGWHPMPYLDHGEFYSEFGSFDVKITLPENYVVGATGDLQNAEEITWLDTKAEATAAISTFPDDLSFPASSGQMKTLHFKQSNVHDFAWFADKRFHVLKKRVKLPLSGREVTCWAMFTNAEAELWKNAPGYIADALHYYSLWVGEYPYNHATAVDGSLSAGDGMEYPNVTVIGEIANARILETVIVHEVGHNWFYGILGNNEREHAWMDEGINTYYERRYFRAKYPDRNSFAESQGLSATMGKKLNLHTFSADYQNNLLYLLMARTGQDQPVSQSAGAFTKLNYGAMLYAKAGLLFRYLEEAVGTPDFDKAMHLYFNEWKFRHPQPEDLRTFFERTSGKDISWFFDEAIRNTEKIDFDLNEVKKDADEPYFIATVENKTPFSAPVVVSSFDKNGNLLEQKLREPFNGVQEIAFRDKDVYRISIDPERIIPEINHKNNSMRMNGIFRKAEPLKFQHLTGLEDPDRTQVFYSFVTGYNYYDKWMPGLAIYNNVFPPQNWQYVLVPLYSVENKKLNGTGRLSYSLYPESVFQRLTASMHYSLFSYFDAESSIYDPDLADATRSLRFRKISPAFEMEFRPDNFLSKHVHMLSLRAVHVSRDNVANFYEIRPDTMIFHQRIERKNYIVNEAVYSFRNLRTLDPFSAKLGLQQHSLFMKSWLEFIYSFTYNSNLKKADIRLFAGKFLFNNSGNLKQYNFSFSGNTDYTYDEVFLYRNGPPSSLQGRQFAVSDGGFKQLTLTEPASDWLTALNIRVPFPFKMPVGIYADYGLSSSDARAHYDGGFYFSFARNIFEIYFPLKMSDDLNMLTYSEKIRYTLNFRMLNPFELLKNLSVIR